MKQESTFYKITNSSEQEIHENQELEAKQCEKWILNEYKWRIGVFKWKSGACLSPKQDC